MWSEYKSWAELCLIEDQKELMTATMFLHNLGSLLYFSEDENLSDVIFLDPQWLTDVMSTVITTMHNYLGREGQEGILQHSVLPFIWRPPTFPKELHGFMLYLLNKFEITFTLDNGKNDGESAGNSDDGNAVLDSPAPTTFPISSPTVAPQVSPPDVGENQQQSATASAPATDVGRGDDGNGRGEGPSDGREEEIEEITSNLPKVEAGAAEANKGSELVRRNTREVLSKLFNRPIAQRTAKGCSLVPALLSTKRPEDLASLWPPRRVGDKVLEFGRIYSFDFVPSGFFAKVLLNP